MNPILWPYRIIVISLLLIAGIGFGYVQGTSRESDRRDALELKNQHAADEAFNKAMQRGREHALAVLTWQSRADIYFRKWQEKLNNEKDSQLSVCQTQTTDVQKESGVSSALLSYVWVGLYNAAWQPEFNDQGDPSRAFGQGVETGSVTPREALDNIAINAHQCAVDRKRLDELIDYLLELQK